MGGLNKSSGQNPGDLSTLADESSVEEVKNAYERLKKTAKIEIKD